VTFYLRQTNPQVVAPILDAMSADEKAKIDDLTPISTRSSSATSCRLKPPADQLLVRFPFLNFVGERFPERTGDRLYRGNAGAPVPLRHPRFRRAHATLMDEGVTEGDWSTDGQNLVYAKTTLPYELLSKGVQLGTITSRQVCGSFGQLLAEFPPAKDLAGVLLSEHVTRVACLPDGRILFAAASRPLAGHHRRYAGSAHAIHSPAGATQSIASVVLPADIERLPNRADRFVLSPDKKKVAIPGNTGQVKHPVPGHGKTRTATRKRCVHQHAKF